MKKITYIRLILIALLSIIVLSNSMLCNDISQETFQKASEEYKNGDFLQAIDNYNKIIDNGYQSSEVYYNLGNAYFKLNKIPQAILNYERAIRLNPSDKDIEFNLRISKLRTVDKIEPLPKLFYEKWWKSISDLFCSDTWSILTTAFIWLGFIALAGFLFLYSTGIKKIAFFVVMFSFVFALLSFIFAGTNFADETSDDNAIIFSESVYVKSSPDKDGTDLFILHEGTKVELLDKVGNWIKIKLINGNIGWLPDDTIETI